MGATESQKPFCPACHQTDQVQTLQAAYEADVAHCAPPPLPEVRAPLMRTMTIGGGIITVCSFLILVLLVPTPMPLWVQGIQVVLTVAAILVVLALSSLAFRRLAKSDLQAQQLLPAWDRALANWSRLRYCKRDNVVFDPQQASYQALSDEAVEALLSVKAPGGQAEEMSASIAQIASR